MNLFSPIAQNTESLFFGLGPNRNAKFAINQTIMYLPLEEEYAPYYRGYVNLASERPFQLLEEQFKEFSSWFNQLTDHQLEYRYEPSKWSLKEVLIHIADAERVFAYRAMCIARGDSTHLPGFDQDQYMLTLDSSQVSAQNIKEEILGIRSSNLALFKSFSNIELERMGTASGYGVSTRALIAIIAGHFQHHMNIINERYLI